MAREGRAEYSMNYVTPARSAGMTSSSLRLRTTRGKQRSNKYCMEVISVERCEAGNEQLGGGKDL